MKTRDLNIELYRILITFGICWFHAVNACGHNNLWISQNLAACVVAFAFISGYFGIKFSWRKVFRLYGVGLYAAFLTMGMKEIFSSNDNCYSFICWLKNVCFQFGGWWFLHAYVVMMSLCPLVEPSLQKLVKEHRLKDAIAMILPLIFVVFVWGFCSEPRCISAYIPHSLGVSSFSGLTLFGVYVVARVISLFDLFADVKTWTWLCVMTGCCVIIPYHFPFYNSPFILMLAVSSFFLFKKIPKVNDRYFRMIISLVSPSMFAVYLLHCNGFSLPLMRTAESALIAKGCPITLAAIMVAVMAFTICLILDIPRRVVSKAAFNAKSIMHRYLALLGTICDLRRE